MKKYLICLFVFLASCSSGKIEFYPNELVISGVPRIKGVITVEIVAKTYASMYSKSQVFTKKYQINVE